MSRPRPAAGDAAAARRGDRAHRRPASPHAGRRLGRDADGRAASSRRCCSWWSTPATSRSRCRSAAGRSRSGSCSTSTASRRCSWSSRASCCSPSCCSRSARVPRTATTTRPVSIFHPSYLILAAGIFTAFIAGDLFNLYVGFEILLVASYVLITLGSTESRIRTGVVYIVVSLVSSILFLAAIAMIYGALGTVNMVQISERMAQLPAADADSCCTCCCCSPSASRPPSSRCRSGCPTRIRPRRRRSPRSSRAC